MNNFINFFQKLLNMPEEDKISSPTSIGNLISFLDVSIQEKFGVVPMEICYPKRMKKYLPKESVEWMIEAAQEEVTFVGEAQKPRSL